MNNKWLNRALIFSGILVTALSLTSIRQLSNRKDLNQQTSSLDSPGKVVSLKGGQANEKQDKLRIGWSDWSDAEIISLMAKKLIEDHYDQPVERIMSEVGIQYASISRGDIDLMLMAWLPKTDRSYWQKVQSHVIDLGRMYTGRIGWVIPDYIPKEIVDNIGDLAQPNIAGKFSNKIQGVGAGSALMGLSEQVLKIYNLNDLQLKYASIGAMISVLDRSIKEKQWVVVTSWTPHWMFTRYQLRFLKDPKNVFRGREAIHAIARMGFDQDHPKVVSFLSRFHLPHDQVLSLILAARKSSPEQAVDNYLETNPNRVNYWINGIIQE